MAHIRSGKPRAGPGTGPDAAGPVCATGQADDTGTSRRVATPDAVGRDGQTPGYDSETVEDAMVRIRSEARGRWPELDQVFLDVTDADAAYGRTHRSDV
ncbi:hypothetical protein [Streptomyces sp. AB3(2024)]|uniref:hypothetical protein n=1 Tax=Streptomyces sp. AB3(2024) TaxID=3317321 RepID=UPI0035A33135